MDFYSLINSKDVSDYLKEMKYEFSIKEAAYVVYKTHKLTLEEKYDAWNWIIDNMSYNQEDKNFCVDLTKYIDVQKKKVAKFYDEDDNAYFQFEFVDSYYMKKKKFAGGFTNFSIHRNLTSCIEYIDRERINSYSDFKFRGIRIIKKWYEREWQEIFAEMNFEHNILRVEIDNYDEGKVLSPEENKIDKMFKNINIYIQSPFKKGDVLGYYYWEEYDISSMYVLDCQQGQKRDEQYVLWSFGPHNEWPYKIMCFNHKECLDYEKEHYQKMKKHLY